MIKIRRLLNRTSTDGVPISTDTSRRLGWSRPRHMDADGTAERRIAVAMDN